MSHLVDCRFVAIERESVAALEALGEELLRRGDPRATKVLALVLAWRYAPTVTRIPFGDDHSLRVNNTAPMPGPSVTPLRLLTGGAE